jgi:hypothetical protein
MTNELYSLLACPVNMECIYMVEYFILHVKADLTILFERIRFILITDWYGILVISEYFSEYIK